MISLSKCDRLAIALHRLFCHSLRDNMIEIDRKPLAPHFQRWNLGIEMLTRDLLARLPAKRRMTSKQAIKHSSHSIDICISINRLTKQLLWRTGLATTTKFACLLVIQT